MYDQAVKKDKPEEILFAEKLATENRYVEAINVLREYLIKKGLS